jgi:hypothetical protein
MTEMVTSGSMSGEGKRSDGLLGESDDERRHSLSAPPALHVTALFLDSTGLGSVNPRIRVLDVVDSNRNANDLMAASVSVRNEVWSVIRLKEYDFVHEVSPFHGVLSIYQRRPDHWPQLRRAFPTKSATRQRRTSFTQTKPRFGVSNR